MTNLTLGFVTRLLLTALILKAAPAASQQAGQLSRKLPGGGSSSCTTALVTTTADCLEVAGIDLSGVNGGQYPDPSEVSCSRDCNKKSIAGCTEDDVASGASYLFKNVQDACDYFVDTCGEVTIDDPVDPGFGVEPSFDFNHCTTMYTGDNHDSCTITEGVEVFNSMSTFSSCSGWSGWEVIQTLIDGEASFGSLITECGDLDEVRRRYREAKRGRSSVTLTPAHNALTLFATPPPPSQVTTTPEDCIHAIHDASEDESNPLHSYISDIYNDPDKYCSCNKDLLGSMPSCSYRLLGGDPIDTNDALMASCIMGELCEEFTSTCKAIGKKMEECVDRSVQTGGDYDCSESCHDFDLPVGCMRDVVEGDLESKLNDYDDLCAGVTPTDPEDPENNVVKSVKITFTSGFEMRTAGEAERRQRA